MPQEVISIQDFGGMMTNPHKEDIPDNMAVYVNNADPQAELGVLKGIEESGASYTANGSALQAITEADWINYDDAGTTKYDLIFIDTTANDITAVENFYGAETVRTLTDLVTTVIQPRCIKTFNNVAQVGNLNLSTGLLEKANAIYRLLENKNFFNSLEIVSAGLQVENGECYNPRTDVNGSIYASATNRYNDSTGYFQNGILYKWATSLVYDGLQESNLVEGATDAEASQGSKVLVTLTARGLNDITLLDSRVTAVKIYRAESSDDTEDNLGLFRLAKTVDINDGVGLTDVEGDANVAVTCTDHSLTDTRLDMEVNAYVGNYVGCGGELLLITSNTADTFTGTAWSVQPADNLAWELIYKYTWVDSGDNYILNYIDDGSLEEGVTYEEETGMPETLEFQSIRYTLNEVGGGYHCVTKGQPENETDIDWQRYFFVSKRYRPNMFNWAKDFLVLPEVPIALAWYNDRFYVFSENTVCRINPELLSIEDTFFGAGASHRQSVYVSEYGLYFCNLNGAYLIKDSGINTISDSIAETPTTGSYIGWKAFASATASSNFDRITIKSEVDKRLILFVGATSGHASDCLGYYIPTGQWRRFSLGGITLGSSSGLYGGKDGEVYISNATASYRLFAGTGFLGATWVSKEFHLNEPSQNKSWNKIKWDATAPGSSSVAVTYGVEGIDPATSATNDAYINIYKKTFQVKIVTTPNGTDNPKVDSLDIITRRLFGKR